MTIREAGPNDAAAIARIYNEGIEDGVATFETRKRTAAEVLEHFLKPGARHPVLVAERGARVVGWAASSRYRERACYDGVAEFSIYVERESRGSGVGRPLLEAFCARCEALGFTKLLSRIFAENSASRGLCAACGFREVGTYRHHGQLHGKWRDCVIVEKLLGAARAGFESSLSPAEALALAFVAKINARDAAGLAELMTEDHEFVDSLGGATKGRDAMLQGWRAYFEWVPDYAIEITERFSRGDVVSLFGFAGGTFATDGALAAEHRWRIPAAWLATARDGRIAKWQVFADNKPMHELLARARA